jgi:hypothetical protein
MKKDDLLQIIVYFCKITVMPKRNHLKIEYEHQWNNKKKPNIWHKVNVELTLV